jgi:hypothetical protein
MKRKPVVGEIIYALNVGNNARYNKQVLRPVTVTKVGRKFFTCEGIGEFALEDWSEKSNYTAAWELYESEQDYADHLEHCGIWRELRDIFGGYRKCNANLEQLREIKRILTLSQSSD